MTLKIQAIQTALTGNWNKAVLLNQKLLKENPNDIEALNRLAFAYTVLRKIKEAKNVYLKVLRIDGQNLIALKNLKRLPGFANSSKHCFLGGVDSMFIEESGKTKVIELINLAEPKTILGLMIGESLVLHIKRLKIFILDEGKQYLGMLPDDIGKRLIKFIKGGNKYQAFVKATESHRASIFIKEVSRANRFKNQPSFSSSGEKVKAVMPNKYYELNKDSQESSSNSIDEE